MNYGNQQYRASGGYPNQYPGQQIPQNQYYPQNPNQGYQNPPPNTQPGMQHRQSYPNHQGVIPNQQGVIPMQQGQPQQPPPKPFFNHPLLNDIRECLDFNEQKYYLELHAQTCKTLIPDMDPNQIQGMKPADLSNRLRGSAYFQQFQNQLLKINQANEIVVERIREQNFELASLQQHVEYESQQFNNQKEALNLAYSRCVTLSERFNPIKILALLDKLKDQLDEQSQSDIDDQDQSVFEKNCVKYLEMRKQYHKLASKQAKFQQIISQR